MAFIGFRVCEQRQYLQRSVAVEIMFHAGRPIASRILDRHLGRDGGGLHSLLELINRRGVIAAEQDCVGICSVQERRQLGLRKAAAVTIEETGLTVANQDAARPDEGADGVSRLVRKRKRLRQDHDLVARFFKLVLAISLSLTKCGESPRWSRRPSTRRRAARTALSSFSSSALRSVQAGPARDDPASIGCGNSRTNRARQSDHCDACLSIIKRARPAMHGGKE